MRAKSKPQSFSKVSEWIAAGNMASGMYCLETVRKETDKAVGFECMKGNDFGYMVKGICWLPKSQLQRVENDFYTDRLGATMWLCPEWLYRRKYNEGIEI